MRYEPYHVHISDEKRAAFNDKIVYAAQNGGAGLSKADCFNAFTGKGGLHGLRRGSYGSYWSYATEKRKREEGQFFTPAWLAAFMAEALGIEPQESVCDPACGHGALFNACFPGSGPERSATSGARLFGCEIDERAASVARHLFPEAHVETGPLSFYDPGVAVDVVLANPPFGLKLQAGGQALRSEEALLVKAAEFLRPGGLLAVIVPASLFSDAFQEKARLQRVQALYRPLASVLLGEDAFAAAGVTGLQTKVLFFQRRGRALDDTTSGSSAPSDAETRPQDTCPLGAPQYTLETPRAGVATSAADALAGRVLKRHVRPVRAAAEEQRAALKLEIRRGRTFGERAAKSRTGFHDRVAKLLFDIRRSPGASKRYARCRATYERFLAHEDMPRPSHLSAEEWEKQRLTEADVTGQLEAVLSGQHEEQKRAGLRRRGLLPEASEGPEAAARLVKGSRHVFYKGYTPEARELLERREAAGQPISWDLGRLACSDAPLPAPVARSKYANAIRRKRQLRRLHEGDLMEQAPHPDVVHWIRRQTIVNPSCGEDTGEDASRPIAPAGRACGDGTALGPLFANPPAPQPSSPGSQRVFHPTRLQAEDLARVLARRYDLLNWQQGSGKTFCGYLALRYATGALSLPAAAREAGVPPARGGIGPVRAMFIVAPALAVSKTWKPFLEAQGQAYRVLKERSDAQRLQEMIRRGVSFRDEMLIVPFSRIARLKRPLMGAVRMMSRKIALLVDESDKMTNYSAKRTQASLAVFRRAKVKLLMTGTVTRNHLAELYGQLELLYNNSALFKCGADVYYPLNDDDELQARPCPFAGWPYPAFRGEKIFAAVHAPRRPTVFGILKQDQDVYNAEVLARLLGRTRIVQTFAEIAGRDRYRLHHTAVPFSPAGAALHEALTTEFVEILKSGWYFEKTSSARKEAGLRALRQLTLLIASAQHPHLFPHYGEGIADAPKYSRKMQQVREMIRSFTGERVAVGLRRREVFGIDYLQHWADYLSGLGRELFVVDDAGNYDRRGATIDAFQASAGGILLSTQQSLPASLNIPRCSRVIIPELSWNHNSHAQYFFRFIRFDMPDKTDVHFVTYEKSIDCNSLRLIVNKEKLNTFVHDGQVTSTEKLLKELQIDASSLDTMMEKIVDEEGNPRIEWTQDVHA